MSSFRKLVPFEQEGGAEQEGGGNKKYTLNRLRSLLLIILKIAQINGYDDETRIRGPDGKIVENSNVIALLNYVTSTGKPLVGEGEFLRLLKKANVDPELILNENAKLKLLSLYNRTEKPKEEDDVNQEAFDELAKNKEISTQTEMEEEIPKVDSEQQTEKEEIPKVDGEQQTDVRKTRNRKSQTTTPKRPKTKTTSVQWEEPEDMEDVRPQTSKRRHDDDEEYDSDATEIYSLPPIKRTKENTRLQTRWGDIINNQPSVRLERLPENRTKEENRRNTESRWGHIINNQPSVRLERL
jgi:outer membrane biosynthesis protein TonB